LELEQQVRDTEIMKLVVILVLVAALDRAATAIKEGMYNDYDYAFL